MSAQPGNFRRGGRRGNAFPIRDAAEVERIRRAYYANEVPVFEVCRRFKMTDHELRLLIARNGWTSRSKMTMQRISSHRKVLPKRRTEADVRAAHRTEQTERQASLYRSAVEDVHYLRRRGFPVDRNGINPKSDAVHFGNTIITFAELREKAARERRLEEAARPVELPRKRGRKRATP